MRRLKERAVQFKVRGLQKEQYSSKYVDYLQSIFIPRMRFLRF